MYLASSKLIFWSIFEIFQCFLDRQGSTSIDLKSWKSWWFFLFFSPREQQNLSVRCWASSNTSRSFSLLCIKDHPCQPGQNYCNQILVFLPCSFSTARRVNQYQPSFLLAMKHRCWQTCLMFLLLLPLFLPIISSIMYFVQLFFTLLMNIFFYWNSDDRTYPSFMYKKERALRVISFMSLI